MRHAVLGPGGVGGLLGAVLAAGGHPVTIIVRPGSGAAHPAQLTLESPFGAAWAPVRVAERLDRPVDVLWLGVKATQLMSSLRQIADPEQARYVIPLLNGVDHVELLRRRWGNGRLVPAAISVESERVAPGHIVVRSPFIRLRLPDRARGFLAPAVAVLQRFGFECGFVADEVTLIWSKLAFLAPVALSTTAAGATIGAVLSLTATSRRLERCLHEACAVAAASGADMDEQVILAGIRGLPAGLRSSMQKDRAAGRPLELDAIAGPIVRGGRRHGIAVPATDELVTACGAA